MKKPKEWLILAKYLPDKYVMEEELGRGGFGVVIRARDVALQRIVAIKMLHLEHNRDPDIVSRFEREAQIAARLRHPNICVIYDIGCHPECNYFVMEYIDGESIKDHLVTRGVFTQRQTITLAVAIAEALAYAHNQNVIHRDIKPDNIIINTENRPIIMDFGIAKALSLMSMKSSRIFGTGPYIAPEQLTGADVDARADQYALGILLYRMLTLHFPFPKDIRHDRLLEYKRQRTVELIPPSFYTKGLNHRLEAAILRCLAASPDERFPDLSAFVGELNQITITDKESVLSQPQGSASTDQQLIHGLIKQGVQALTQKEFSKALAVFHQALQLDPLNHDVQFYREQAQRKLAQEEEIQGYFAAATDALTVHDYKEAMRLWRRILVLDESNVRARTFLKETEQTAQKLERADGFYQSAVQALNAKNYQQAVSLCEQALVLREDWSAAIALRESAAQLLLQDVGSIRQLPENQATSSEQVVLGPAAAAVGDGRGDKVQTVGLEPAATTEGAELDNSLAAQSAATLDSPVAPSQEESILKIATGTSTLRFTSQTPKSPIPRTTSKVLKSRPPRLVMLGIGLAVISVGIGFVLYLIVPSGKVVSLSRRAQQTDERLELIRQPVMPEVRAPTPCDTRLEGLEQNRRSPASFIDDHPLTPVPHDQQLVALWPKPDFGLIDCQGAYNNDQITSRWTATCVALTPSETPLPTSTDAGARIELDSSPTVPASPQPRQNSQYEAVRIKVRRCLQQGRYLSALNELRNHHGLGFESQWAAAVLEEIAQKCRFAKPDEWRRLPVSDKQRLLYDYCSQLINSTTRAAHEAAQSGAYPQALDLCAEILALEATHQETMALKATYDRRYQQRSADMVRLRELVDRRQYREASAFLAELLEQAPDDEVLVAERANLNKLVSSVERAIEIKQVMFRNVIERNTEVTITVAVLNGDKISKVLVAGTDTAGDQVQIELIKQSDALWTGTLPKRVSRKSGHILFQAEVCELGGAKIRYPDHAVLEIKVLQRIPPPMIP